LSTGLGLKTLTMSLSASVRAYSSITEKLAKQENAFSLAITTVTFQSKLTTNKSLLFIKHPKITFRSSLSTRTHDNVIVRVLMTAA